MRDVGHLFDDIQQKIVQNKERIKLEQSKIKKRNEKGREERVREEGTNADDGRSQKGVLYCIELF